MSSLGGAATCAGCGKFFKRLSTHIALSPTCEQLYTTTGNVVSNVASRRSTRIRVSSLHDSSVVCQDDGISLPKAKTTNKSAINCEKRTTQSTIGDKSGLVEVEAHVDVMPGDDEDDFQLFDDTLPCNEAAHNQHIDNEDAPDRCVLELYKEMQESRANPLGLDRFSVEEKVHIELLHILKSLNAPLKAFSHILNWAAKANNSGHIFKEDCQPSREKVVQNLYCRYNMKGLKPKEKLLYLPYSQRVVSMIYFDAREVFASLLACPVLNRDENFMFDSPAKDPFVEPTKSSHIGDINTGRCYRKSYEALVKKKDVDMLLPTVIALDKTQADTYGRLQMEPMTISHGLLKHSVRSQHTAMRILGYIFHGPTHQPNFKDGKVIIHDRPLDLPSGTVIGHAPLKPLPNITWSTYILNEMHMQINFILEESGFLDLQRNGFHWMLHYNQKVHPIVLHPYIPFIIGDTEGHDRLCGHYTARFSSIKQLCRVCECPTLESGYSKGKYRFRKPSVINKLVRAGNLKQLKGMSQNYLHNGFHLARFGLHNDRGIFGACPGEMLHLISLGWFKYCLEGFAAQAGGPNSVGLKQYDRLCALIGKRLSRQSDRDLPRMNFPKGFSSGANLMGHEITGCLLVKLFAFHTTMFRQIFASKKHLEKLTKNMSTKRSKKSKKSKKFLVASLQSLNNDAHIDDWVDLVSSLLQWHQWMKQPRIARLQVSKSQYAVRWLMRRLSTVSPRVTGMCNNTIKMHLVLHVCEDILDHGVPDNVNSAYAESAHIPLSKDTSRNTQKRAGTFTLQSATRYQENLAISSAWHDMANESTGSIQNDVPACGTLSGRGFTISWRDGDRTPIFLWNRKYPSDNPIGDTLSHDAMSFLGRHCLPHMTDGYLPCFTEFVCENGHKYRAHPCIYDGQPWHDHAMVTWRGYINPLPAFIHTFVDLRNLPPRTRITRQESGKPTITEGGVYALVHSFDAIDDKIRDFSNTMIGHYKLHRDGLHSSPTLYLVAVHNLVAPTIGIQDVGVSAATQEVEDPHYLFLFRRKEEWASCWDSMVNKCHSDRDSESVESAYEEEAKDDDDIDVDDEDEDEDDEDVDVDVDDDDDDDDDDDEDEDDDNVDVDDDDDDDDEDEDEDDETTTTTTLISMLTTMIKMRTKGLIPTTKFVAKMNQP